eukprot:GHVP01038053.1.p1 GENE.GHVP01038053.1~~GHVP01038053.1.p1  ORF type:complete len:100 (+),score=5.86 GHVP01038053.1:82-381(+)
MTILVSLPLLVLLTFVPKIEYIKGTDSLRIREIYITVLEETFITPLEPLFIKACGDEYVKIKFKLNLRYVTISYELLIASSMVIMFGRPEFSIILSDLS